jgi:hypothetical protein
MSGVPQQGVSALRAERRNLSPASLEPFKLVYFPSKTPSEGQNRRLLGGSPRRAGSGSAAFAKKF